VCNPSLGYLAIGVHIHRAGFHAFLTLNLGTNSVSLSLERHWISLNQSRDCV
jgi:hypothetical protein